MDNDDSLINEVDHEFMQRDDETMVGQVHKDYYKVACSIRYVIVEEVWRDYQIS